MFSICKLWNFNGIRCCWISSFCSKIHNSVVGLSIHLFVYSCDLVHFCIFLNCVSRWLDGVWSSLYQLPIHASNVFNAEWMIIFTGSHVLLAKIERCWPTVEMRDGFNRGGESSSSVGESSRGPIIVVTPLEIYLPIKKFVGCHVSEIYTKYVSFIFCKG